VEIGLAVYVAHDTVKTKTTITARGRDIVQIRKPWRRRLRPGSHKAPTINLRKRFDENPSLTLERTLNHEWHNNSWLVYHQDQENETSRTYLHRSRISDRVWL